MYSSEFFHLRSITDLMITYLLSEIGPLSATHPGSLQVIISATMEGIIQATSSTDQPMEITALYAQNEPPFMRDCAKEQETLTRFLRSLPHAQDENGYVESRLRSHVTQSICLLVAFDRDIMNRLTIIFTRHAEQYGPAVRQKMRESLGKFNLPQFLISEEVHEDE
jgi:hypothetical protein